MVTITLPIYYTQDYKTKKSKTYLVGLNNYRNWHHRFSNIVKIHYHELVLQAIGDNKFKKIKLLYRVYVGRKNIDGSNIRSVIEKFFLDGLVESGAIQDDSVEYVVGDSSEYYLDKERPRIEITIINVN